MVVWRFAKTAFGMVSVTITGAMLMQELSAGSWDLQMLVSIWCM